MPIRPRIWKPGSISAEAATLCAQATQRIATQSTVGSALLMPKLNRFSDYDNDNDDNDHIRC